MGRQERGVANVIRRTLQRISPAKTRPVRVDFSVSDLSPAVTTSAKAPIPNNLVLSRNITVVTALGGAKQLISVSLMRIGPVVKARRRIRYALITTSTLVGAFSKVG